MGVDIAETEAAAGELFFGLVHPIGTRGKAVLEAISRELDEVSCRATEVRLVEALHKFSRWRNLPHRDERARYKSHIEAGGAFCLAAKREDALALLGITEVLALRARRAAAAQAESLSAYVFRSLKRPREVQCLRATYGQGFILIAAYSPKEERVDNLARRFAAGAHSTEIQDFVPDAQLLVNTDEKESDAPFGQNVRETFPLADIFIDASNPGQIQASMKRLVELLFGHQFHTPTRDEFGMMHAHIASLRSADLARQVGAALAAADGTILATGCNEVPAGGGGQYWADHDCDCRDFHLGADSSFEHKRTVVADIIDRLGKLKKLSASWRRKLAVSFEAEIDELLEHAVIKEARLMSSIEFSRSVHAEMSCLMDAARHGRPVLGCTLYTTTFPCHDCARHIVAAGISRVVFIEPYPKSLAIDLYSDSIAVQDPSARDSKVRFDPYVGVAPRLYRTVFEKGERREGKTRQPVVWRRNAAVPRIIGNPASYMPFETFRVSEFRNATTGLKLAQPARKKKS